MTREQWKERLHLVQAFVEGKRIETRLGQIDAWIVDTTMDFTLDPSMYRIAPEPKYRPWRAGEVPLGIEVRAKTSTFRQIIEAVDTSHKGSVRLSLDSWMHFDTLLKNYTLADGSPCGVKEEAS